jgi:crotonobetainyl-CoA:carnitine CoA-transferase CaiB-like acyl-CoA transferase
MPFSSFRALQIGSGVALDYCGKLFADFGADVIKLEPEGGDPNRALPPVLANGESGYFCWLNTNKRSVTDTPETRAALIQGADVLLDGTPPGETDHAALREAHPGLAITHLSWFGEHGPYRDFAATDATVRALGGLVALTGRAEGPPTLATDNQSTIIAGIAAFIATASGLWGRDAGARRFAVSVHDATINISEYEAAVAWDAGGSRKRMGLNRFARNYPVGVYPTKQGMIGVTVVTPGQWRAYCAMMGKPELAREPRFSSQTDRLRNSFEIDAIFCPILMTRTAEEWFEQGLIHKLPIVPVPSMAELLEQSVPRERGAFVPVQIGEDGFEAPVIPQHLTLTPPRQGGAAQFAAEDHPLWATPAQPKPEGQAAAGTLPLTGLRIIDLTMGWAGPTGARHLADLGAEVIKVEATQYPDWWRGTDLRAQFIAEQRYEKIPWFQLMNRNKIGITLDLVHPDGAALLKRLVATAHGVIENYSAGVLAKLNLDYTVLKDVRPGLVMLSMPAFGMNNAWSDLRAYGSTLEHASGLPMVTGFPDDPPTMNQTAYGDPVGGFNAAAALIAALLHQKRTGQGQAINLSQVECLLPFVAAPLIEQSALGRVSPRLGNRHPTHVPHGAFRCAGDDHWLIIAVRSDAEWRALCAVMGREDLAGLTTAERRAREDELEAVIGAWTGGQVDDDAMKALQAAQVACGVMRVPFDLNHDPHLVARGFWHRMIRPFIGLHTQGSPAFREGPLPYPVRHMAPTLGQGNREVLCGMLGVPEADLERLAAEGIIGTVPNPRRAQGDA